VTLAAASLVDGDLAAPAGRKPEPVSAAFAPVLDITRLARRMRYATPTGIDRVEAAYARQVLADPAGRFALWLPGLGPRATTRRAARRFLDLTEARWAGERVAAGALFATLLTGLRRLPPPASADAPTVLLTPSHQHLDKPGRVSAFQRRIGGRLAVFLHDTIPVDYPEYARADGRQRHHIRLEQSVAHADALIVNSAATAEALRPYLKARRVPVITAPLGLSFGPVPTASALRPERPYFLCVGTIEPRKNHLLLLHIWRDWAKRVGPTEAPKLILVGRRGWENEQIVDLLERCPALQGVVEERAGVSDAELISLMAGARAVLMPSFIEGYGLPVAEALAAGAPVIASTTPAHREVGGDAPEYLDPLDGLGWAALLEDYARPDSRLRAAQLQRLAAWRAPTWADHFQIVWRALADGVERGR
jgi:glycosyltransferase involved in cell wall biosynthesis